MSSVFNLRSLFLFSSMVVVLACPNESKTTDPVLGQGSDSDGTSSGEGTTIADTTSEIVTGSTTTDGDPSLTGDLTTSTPDTTGSATDVDAGECGNGELEPGEECDDGNDPYCTSACTVSVCGDEIVWAPAGEECDDGIGNVDDVYGKCTTECLLAPRCGDNVVQQEEGEICDGTDDGDDENGDSYSGPPCTPTCRFDAKFVFVSSVPHNGSFGDPLEKDGLKRADEFCNELGQPIVEGLTDAGGDPLQIEFRAWLSSASESVAERFTTYEDKIYALRNGTTLAENWSAFVDGAIDAPITITENNESLKSVQIWTNTDAHGEKIPYNADCVGWTANGIGNSGIVGVNSSGSHLDGTWTYDEIDNEGGASCAWSAYLYCVEQ